jgi:hypothetical protein
MLEESKKKQISLEENELISNLQNIYEIELLHFSKCANKKSKGKTIYKFSGANYSIYHRNKKDIDTEESPRAIERMGKLYKKGKITEEIYSFYFPGKKPPVMEQKISNPQYNSPIIPIQQAEEKKMFESKVIQSFNPPPGQTPFNPNTYKYPHAQMYDNPPQNYGNPQQNYGNPQQNYGNPQGNIDPQPMYDNPPTVQLQGPQNTLQLRGFNDAEVNQPNPNPRAQFVQQNMGGPTTKEPYQPVTLHIENKRGDAPFPQASGGSINRGRGGR